MNDQRYILSALLAHVLWGISWTLMTLPLLVSWREWNRVRMQAIDHLALEKVSGVPDTRAMLELLKEVQPVAWTNVVVSQVVAAASFLLPLLQVLIK